MSAVSEKCIFCSAQIDPRTIEPEHIIPGSIDGSVVTYNVCKKCNNTLGTEVDAELNRHRHIWDGRKKHQGLPPPESPFRMLKKFAIDSDGTEVPLVARSDSNIILTHSLPDGGMQIDRHLPLRKDPYYKYLDTERKKVGMDDETFKKEHVERYVKAKEKGSYLGKKTYRDWLFIGMDAYFGEDHPSRTSSIMSCSIPDRFVSKACMEYAYLFELQNEIANIEEIRNHAINGKIDKSKIEFGENLCRGDEIFPCHAIAFCDEWFSLGIYDFYFIGVRLIWRNEPKRFVCADDFLAKKLRICEGKDGVYSFNTAVSFDFKAHAELGRPTHR